MADGSYGTKPSSVKWKIEPSLPFTQLLTLISPENPVPRSVIVTSSPKPMRVTVTLMAALNDEVAFVDYVIVFGGSPLPDPTPEPVKYAVPDFPSWSPQILDAVRQAFVDGQTGKTPDEMQQKTMNSLTAKIGINVFVKEVLPWRTQFTEYVDSLKLETVQELQNVWKAVEKKATRSL